MKAGSRIVLEPMMIVLDGLSLKCHFSLFNFSNKIFYNPKNAPTLLWKANTTQDSHILKSSNLCFQSKDKSNTWHEEP